MANQKFLDIFCGMGALSHGFESAGFSPVLAIEANSLAAATYALNRPSVPVLLGDCRKFGPHEVAKIIGHIDAIVGGVPCEPFSTSRGYGDKARSQDPKDDPRRGLIYYALKSVAANTPAVFAFENVRAAVKSDSWIRAKRKLARLGYDVDVWILKADEHGSATIRTRAFLVGAMGGSLPPQSDVPRAAAKSVRDAFRGLGRLSADGPHADPGPLPDKLRRALRFGKPGGALRNPDHPAMRRDPKTGQKDSTTMWIGSAWLKWNRPSLSLIASQCAFVHPDMRRVITGREMARLQGVPDSYKFANESRTGMLSLLGDCVPVELGRAVALALKGAMSHVRKVEVEPDELEEAYAELAKAVEPDETTAPAGPPNAIYEVRVKGEGKEQEREPSVLCPWCGDRGVHTACANCGKATVSTDRRAKAVEEGEGRECAPTHPSGEQQGRRIYLHEVLEKVRPFRFRQDAITIVGGIANLGWTDNDIDVLIKGPLDEDTLHVLQFRLGRMLGPELSQRVQFLSDAEFGGPFTDHVPLGNLMFETLPEFQVKEMRGFGVTKQDDPLQDLPLKPGKLDAVFQLHARGRTVHGDFRIKVRDYLVGYTLPLQIAGAIKEPITTVAQLKAIARNYDVETGNKFLKPMLAPKGLFATPKPSRQPVVWMEVENRVFPAGTVGGTKEHVGVIIVLDRPKIEYGQVSPRFHEYFITDSKLKSGLWFVRMLMGEEEEVPEAEVGRVTPAGEIFWKFSISKLFMPSILKPRTVKRKVMPPDGWSWIPQSLERDVPPEFRYWKKKGAEARKIRDALVEERIFTEKTVGLVDGEFRLVRAKRYVVNDGAAVGLVAKQPKRTEYVVSRQSFRGPIVVRAGFSKVFWWLVLDKTGKAGVFAWRVQTDPLGGEARISAVEASAAETRDKALLTLSGDQPPGSKWNPTKATPSDVSPVGDGKVEVLEEKAGFLRLRFTSGPLRGVWSLAAEEPGSPLWELSTVTGPGRPLAAEKAEESTDETEPVAGAVPLRDTVQIWDPDKKRPDIDRTDLRPLANFAPMKPREGFFNPNELIDEWATPEIVQAGLDVEGKVNGLRCICEVDGRGRTFIYFEDSRDDRSKILPGVAAEVKALGEKIGPFILDTELLDFDEDGNAQPRRTLSRFTGPVKPQDDSRVKLMAFRLVYGLGRNWTADPRSDARPALEKFFKKAGRLKHLKILPFRTVMSIDEIPSLIKWASEQPGGEGAMFKMHESTYTLGRFTSSWSKLKITRTVRAIVVEKIPKKPAPEQKVPARTFVYRCAVGPIAKKDLDNFGELVKIKDKWYAKIGKTFATNVQARVGQTLEVQATEFLVDLSVPKKTVHWFTPVVTARVDERPSTFDEVVDAVFEHEIKRPVEKLLDGPVRLLKAEEKNEERFVLGIVSEPRTDSQDDLAPKMEIRKACHEYMEFYRGTGLMHRERLFGGRVRICECWYQRGDTEINGEPVYDGSWLMAWRVVDDALWKDVKDRKLTGFSIQGSAVREPVK